ncbi:MAG: dehydrogenase, partial [Acidobacteriota bacterium]
CAPEELSGRFDLAFHASSSSAGLQLSLANLGSEGRVIELSWYGTERVSLSLGEEFHPLRLSIQGTQVSSISQKQRARWDFYRRKALVFRLLEDSGFDSHLSEVIRFTELASAYPKILQPLARGLGYIIRYDQRNEDV